MIGTNQDYKNFLKWLNSDNVIILKKGVYTCQCIQYTKRFTFSEIYKYYLKEYCNFYER